MFGKIVLFDYNWDVNKYKSKYDPEYWEICKTFMEVHKTKYSEPRLLHLTEAFYQMGVYGSSYDAKTTRMVSALAVEVLEDFLNKHPGTLRHPFKVAAAVCSEVIDISKDDSPRAEDSRKSSKSQSSNSIWDVAVDTNIIVNVLQSQHLNSLFKSFIIIYDIKQNSMMNDDKVSILVDSFKRSKFGPLYWDKSDEQNTTYPIKLSLKWKGTVLAEAVGTDENVLRLRVAQALLSKLANLCYGIEAKWMYYRDGKMPDMFYNPNPKRSNIYKVLTHSQFRGMVDIISYIDTFANSDSFSEIVFGVDFSSSERTQIMEHVTKAWGNKLMYRTVSKMGVKSKNQTHVCVYQIRSGEELKRWLEKSMSENERYRLIRPKGHRRAGSCDKNIREVLSLSQKVLKDNEEKKTSNEEELKKEKEQKKRREIEEKKKREEEEKKKVEEEEWKRKEEEKKRKEEEEKKNKKEEEQKKKDEEEKKRKEEGEKKLLEEKKKKLENKNKDIVYPYEDAKQNCDEGIETNFEKLLGGFVLFYDAKKNSEIDKDDWFSALLDSFKMSKFGPLEVLNENLRPMRTRCAFKWKDQILASAEGLTETQAKTAATLQLISKLEPFTYIIQAKEEYFFGGKVPPFIENPDPSKNHIYRVYRRQDLPSYYSIFQIIDEFLNVPSYGEIIFGNDFTWELKNEIVVYIKAKDLDYRYFTAGDQKPWTHMAVYHTVNPEALKNHLLNNGGENAKYKLIPPPNAEPIPNKTAEAVVFKVPEKPVSVKTVTEKPVTDPLPAEKVGEKRKQPEKESSSEELEGNKIQIKLKKFKLDKHKVEYPEDTGGDFPGLILWIGIKKNSTWQRSTFCILLESFKMSKYGELLVEEDEEKVWGRKEPLKKCVIKSNRKVLAVGLGESKTEAKNSAALQVLRQLRKYCFTIQAKESYFKEGKATPYDFEPEDGKDNVYRLAKRSKFKDRASIIKFVDTFNKTSCSHEIIFGDDFSYDEREAILLYCRQINLPHRLMKCQSTGRMIHTHIAIYHQKPLPTIKAALMAAGGEDDKFRLVPPGGKISTQNSETDLWPETLESASLETSANLMPSIDLTGPDDVASLPSTVKVSSTQQVPVKKVPPPNNTSVPVTHVPGSQQPHPDMPLVFGTQPQPAVCVPMHLNEVQPVAADTSVEQGQADVVTQQPDLREELTKKREEESLRKKAVGRQDKSTEGKVLIKKDENDKSWSRKIFVPDSKINETTDQRIRRKSPDRREREMDKDSSSKTQHRNSREKTYQGASKDTQNQNNQTLMSRKRLPRQYHQESQRSNSPSRRSGFTHEAISLDRNPMRCTEKERYRSPFRQEEKRIVRKVEGTSHDSHLEDKRHFYAQSPIEYMDDRRQYRSQSPIFRSNVDWRELAEKYSKDIFVYKYVKQDSKAENDPVALLNATKSYRFNIDFDFVTKQLSFNEWSVNVELIAEDSGRPANLLVGGAVATNVDDAKLMAAQHAIETLQKTCRVIEPNFYYFANGGVPEFIDRKSPMKTHVYEIIQNMEPEFPLDRFTVQTMLKMFLSSKLEDLFFLATDFSYGERMIVIEIADKMNLWWRLFGPRHHQSGQEDIVSTQHVCVYKQKSALQLFEELLENRGSTEKYVLLDPSESRNDPFVDPFKRHIEAVPSPARTEPFRNKGPMPNPVPNAPFGKKKLKGHMSNPTPAVPLGKKKKKHPIPGVPFGKKMRGLFHNVQQHY